jgi:steroid delta-isomerase-like uncharacterized protein
MESQNVGIVQRHIDEIINQNRAELIPEFYADDVVYYDPFTEGKKGVGLKALTDFIVATRDAFPDFHFDLEKIIADGDTVAWYGRATGTHDGDFPGLPASHRPIDIPMCQIFKFNAEGKINTLWVFTDSLGLVQQVGALG